MRRCERGWLVAVVVGLALAWCTQAGVLVSDRQGDDDEGEAAAVSRPVVGQFPLLDVAMAADVNSKGSCQAGCDQVWSTCVDFAEQRLNCCYQYCQGPAECSLCPFWFRTDVLICSYQRLCCIVEICDGQPPGSCGKPPAPAGQSPPDACVGI